MQQKTIQLQEHIKFVKFPKNTSTARPYPIPSPFVMVSTVSNILIRIQLCIYIYMYLFSPKHILVISPLTYHYTGYVPNLHSTKTPRVINNYIPKFRKRCVHLFDTGFLFSFSLSLSLSLYLSLHRHLQRLGITSPFLDGWHLFPNPDIKNVQIIRPLISISWS